jgi:hypothetical protein
MKLTTILALSCVLGSAYGCAEKGQSTQIEKKISKATPQKVTAQAAPKKVATSQPIKAKPAGKLPPGHPPMNKGAAKGAASRPAASRPASAPVAQQIGPPGIIKGRVEISEALRGKVKAGTTLFISVRRFEGEGKRGMIMAAKKLPVGGASLFPLDFTISQRDVMMGGTKLNGSVTLAARIDQDGDAISKQAGDIEGTHKGSIFVGKGTGSILLDTLRQ